MPVLGVWASWLHDRELWRRVADDRLIGWISLGVLASWVPNDAVEVTGKTARRSAGSSRRRSWCIRSRVAGGDVLAGRGAGGDAGHRGGVPRELAKVSIDSLGWDVPDTAAPDTTPLTIKLANPDRLTDAYVAVGHDRSRKASFGDAESCEQCDEGRDLDYLEPSKRLLGVAWGRRHQPMLRQASQESNLAFGAPI